MSVSSYPFHSLPLKLPKKTGKNILKLFFSFISISFHSLLPNEGLEFVAKLGITNAILEGDFAILMKALSEEDHPLSSYGLIIEDVNFCFSKFNQLHYSHVRRIGNRVAHNLARHTLMFTNFIV